MNKFFSIFLIAVIANYLPAQSMLLHSPEHRIKFAKQLSAEGDHLRASEEYDAVFRRNSDTIYLIKSGISLFRLGKYPDAERKLAVFNSSYKDEAEVFSALCGLYIETPTERESNDIIKPEYLPSLELLKSYDYARRLGFSESAFHQLVSNPLLCREHKEELQYKMNNLRLKSGFAAALLSAIIPGSGKIYTGDYSDGITALLTTSLFAYLSVINFNAHHDTRGYIFAASAAGFYAGGIYGSYTAARKHNLEANYTLSVEIDEIFRANSYFLSGELKSLYED